MPLSTARFSDEEVLLSAQKFVAFVGRPRSGVACDTSAQIVTEPQFVSFLDSGGRLVGAEFSPFALSKIFDATTTPGCSYITTEDITAIVLARRPYWIDWIHLMNRAACCNHQPAAASASHNGRGRKPATPSLSTESVAPVDYLPCAVKQYPRWAAPSMVEDGRQMAVPQTSRVIHHPCAGVTVCPSPRRGEVNAVVVDLDHQSPQFMRCPKVHAPRSPRRPIGQKPIPARLFDDVVEFFGSPSRPNV